MLCILLGAKRSTEAPGKTVGLLMNVEVVLLCIIFPYRGRQTALVDLGGRWLWSDCFVYSCTVHCMWTPKVRRINSNSLAIYFSPMS